MTPDEIKKTRLYRTLAPKIRKQDREEFARMLAMAPESARLWEMHKATSLIHAFWWLRTPQGDDYWRNLWSRLCRYGAGSTHQLPKDFQP